MKSQGLSIKYKLLILLVALPTLTLALYLALAMRIFKSDKIAYVYDSSSAVSKTLSAQVRAELNSFASVLKPIWEGYDTKKDTFNNLSKKLFEKDETLFYLATYRTNGSKGFLKTQEQTRKKIVNSALLDSLTIGLVTKAKTDGMAIQSFWKTVDGNAARKKSFLIFALKIASNKQLPSYLVAVQEAQAFFKPFEKSGAYLNFLVDSNGSILLQPDGNWPFQTFGDWTFFEKIQSKKLPMMTSEVENPQTRKKLLLSYSKVGLGNLGVISLVETEKALQAAQVLLWKSVLFFIALISLSVIVSVFASRKVTKSIRDLYSAILKVAQGDFEISVPATSNDEVGGLTLGFNKMTSDLKVAHEKLQDYAKNLEIKVAERTRELAEANRNLDAMVNSLGQGFLVFNQEGMCAPLFSKACLELLEGDPAGRLMWEVVRVEPTKHEDFRNWCKMLFDEPLPFTDLIGLAPKTFAHSQNKHITLEYFPIRSEENKITGVVVVATDKTQEMEATQLAQKEARFAKRVLRITKNKQRFQDFAKGAYATLKEVEQILNKKSMSDDSVECIFRMVHTLKGDSGTFMLDTVVQKVHLFEEEIQNLRKEKSQKRIESIPGFLKYIAETRSLLDHFLSENKDVVGDIQKMEKTLDIPFKDLEAFLSQLGSDSKYLPLAEDFKESFLKEPVEKFFTHYTDLAADLSQKKEKKLLPLMFKGGDLRVWAATYMELFSTFVHAVRNSIDHGIEAPAQRQSSGKKSEGSLAIEFSKRTDKKNVPWLDIVFKDDGKGIDPNTIRKKLLKNGYEKAQKETDEQIIAHIFDSGFSTNETANELSGRGVGMGAIKAEAEKLGGTIEVTSKVGVGTQVTVSVPELEPNTTIVKKSA